MEKTLRMMGILVLTLAIVFTMSAGAFAQTKTVDTNRITKSEALEIALKDAGLTKDQVKNIEKDYDDGKFEIEFTQRGTKEEYDYEISKRGKILEKSVDFNLKRVKGKPTLSEKEAIDLVSEFTGVKKSVIKRGDIELDKEDGQWVYEFDFQTKKWDYEVELHAKTGNVLEYSMDRN